MNNKRYSYQSGNSTAFGRPVQGTRDIDQMYFLLYHSSCCSVTLSVKVSFDCGFHAIIELLYCLLGEF